LARCARFDEKKEGVEASSSEGAEVEAETSDGSCAVTLPNSFSPRDECINGLAPATIDAVVTEAKGRLDDRTISPIISILPWHEMPGCPEPSASPSQRALRATDRTWATHAACLIAQASGDSEKASGKVVVGHSSGANAALRLAETTQLEVLS